MSIPPDQPTPQSGTRPDTDLLPRLYDHLRHVAQQQFADERSNHTLSATALVHEAWIKLAKPRDQPFANRAHFFSAAAEAMRQILIDHARAKARLKRGVNQHTRADLDAAATIADRAETNPAEFLALDEAICRLKDNDPRAAEIVRLRYFAGLSVPETAELLGVSEKTVKNDWAFAKAWLNREIGGNE